MDAKDKTLADCIVVNSLNISDDLKLGLKILIQSMYGLQTICDKQGIKFEELTSKILISHLANLDVPDSEFDSAGQKVISDLPPLYPKSSKP